MRIPYVFRMGLTLCLTAFAWLLVACSDEDKPVEPTSPPHFVASPDTLLITDAQLVDSFQISLDAPGSVTWQVTQAPAWVSIVPANGTVGQSIAAITVTADTAGLAIGTHSGRIELISTAGDEAVAILLDVDVHPRISSSVSQLDFADSVNQMPFSISNSGTGTLSWTATPGAAWLSLTPTSGFLAAGNSVSITATVNRTGLDTGTHSTQVTTTSNSQFGELNLGAYATVPAFTLLSTTPASVAFDYFTASRTLFVHNSGNVAMTWTASASQPFVQLAPSSGTVAPGDSQQVGITVNRTGLATGNHSSSVFVSEVSGQSDTISLAMKQFLEEKWLIHDSLVDAEFDTVHNVVVGVTASPFAVLVIDPFGETIDTIALPTTPWCIGLRPDGAFAAIGHDGNVTIVDLIARSVVQTYPVSLEVCDIIFPSNGWVYVMPLRDQWTDIHCLELATGYETPDKGFYISADSRMRMHPSEDYFYVANRHISPTDFFKFDLRTDTAIYMYDSPYHGDYDFNGDVWISEDGSRLYARSGNTFRSSSTQSQDMLYAGAMDLRTWFRWVDNSVEAGRIAAVSEFPVDSIRVYDDQYLDLKGWLKLPRYLVPDGGEGGTLYRSEAQFAFFDGPGQNYIVLVRPVPASGLSKGWAVVKSSVAAGP